MRELENAIERAVVLAEEPVLARRALPDPAAGGRARRGAGAAHARRPGISIPGSTLADIEREAILRTLEAVGGSTLRAAEMLGISPRKIQYKLKEYQQRDAVKGK